MAKVKIEELRLRNFRAFKNARFVLDDELTVLIGRNGSGKSTIMEAFDFVRDALTEGLDVAIGNKDGIYELTSRQYGVEQLSDISISLIIRVGDEMVLYGLTFGYGDSLREVEVKEERIISSSAYIIRTSSGIETNFHPLAVEPSKGSLLLPLVAGVKDIWLQTLETLRKIPVYSISPSAMRPLQHKSSSLWLERDGGNAADIMSKMQSDAVESRRDEEMESALSYSLKKLSSEQIEWLISIFDGVEEAASNLEQAAVIDLLNKTWKSANAKPLLHSRSGSTRWITRYLSSIIDGLDYVYADEVNRYMVLNFGQHSIQGFANFNADEVSDGTLRSLGILLALKQKPTPTLVFIDEIEDSLHPEAVSTLLDAIKESTEEFQVVITTHNPQVLDNPAIKPEAIRVVEWHDGTSWVYPLHERVINHLKTEEAVGEMFTMDLLRTADEPMTLEDDNFFKIPPSNKVAKKRAGTRRKQTARKVERDEEQQDAA